MTDEKNNKKPTTPLRDKAKTWATNKLNGVDNRLSQKGKWVAYGAISICLIALVIWNLTRAFSGDYEMPNFGNIEHRTVDVKNLPDPNNIKARKMDLLLENLKANPETRHIYDSLKVYRPGLFDTINYYKNK